MNPVRDALIAGVLPGAIATLALLAAGLTMALRRGPLPPLEISPGRARDIHPRGMADRGLVFAAMLTVGGGVVLSMRLLEAYPGWWPLNVSQRTPTLVGIAAIAAAVVAAGPARWWFALPVGVLTAGIISHGVRAPLPFTENLPLAVALDALALGPAAVLVQTLIDRAANIERSLLTRPLPIVALALALLPVPGILFFAGISVSSRQFGIVPAVLMSSAIVLAIVGHSAARGAFRGVGVLVTLAIGTWMLLARTLGEPVLGDWAVGFLLVAACGAGVAAVLLPGLKRWWTPALLTLSLVGAPVAAAAFVQYQTSTAGDDAGPSPADYGY